MSCGIERLDLSDNRFEEEGTKGLASWLASASDKSMLKYLNVSNSMLVNIRVSILETNEEFISFIMIIKQ